LSAFVCFCLPQSAPIFPSVTADRLLVTVLGLLAALWVLWYFLVPPRPAAQLTGRADGRRRDVDVLVKGGYEPAVISIQPGERVRLNFYRDETDSCSERVVFEGLDVSRALPAFETTTVELGPLPSGEYPFHCAMNMLKGRIVVAA